MTEEPNAGAVFNVDFLGGIDGKWWDQWQHLAPIGDPLRDRTPRSAMLGGSFRRPHLNN